MRQVALAVGVSTSTVARICRTVGLSRLRSLEPPAPPIRYEGGPNAKGQAFAFWPLVRTSNGTAVQRLRADAQNVKTRVSDDGPKSDATACWVARSLGLRETQAETRRFRIAMAPSAKHSIAAMVGLSVGVSTATTKAPIITELLGSEMAT